MIKLLRAAQPSHRDDFWINHELARALAWSKPPQLDEAIRYYTAAVAISPKSGPALGNLSTVLLEKGMIDEAMGICQDLIRSQPNSGFAHYNLARAFERTKRFDEAIAEYRQVSRIEPKSAIAHFNLAGVFAQTGRIDEAIAEYHELFRLEPNSEAGHYNFAGLLRNLGKIDMAVAEYREVLRIAPNSWGAFGGLREILLTREPQRRNEVWAEWQRFLRSKPADHNAWFGFAELCLFLGRKEEYEVARQALLDQFASTTDPLVAERTSCACLLLPATGDILERAVALADRALAAGPEHEAFQWFQVVKGLAEYRQGQYERAMERLQKTMPLIVPPNPALLLSMAQHRLGLKKEARTTLAAVLCTQDWRDARAVTHDFWIAHILRSEAETLIAPELAAAARAAAQDEIRKFKGAHEGNVAAYRLAIAPAPDLAMPHTRFMWVLKSIGDFDGAIGESRKSISLASKDALSHNNLAWLLATHPDPARRDPEEAVTEAKKAIELDPKNVLIWNTLGVAQYRCGQWQEAIAALEKSNSLRSGGDANDWLFLAMANSRLGRSDLALSWYQKSCDWLEKNKVADDELARFRVEAEEQLKISKAQAAPKAEAR